ncbi:MAG: hypothetical protein ACLFRP_06785 [Puniceicoccaceae bacterium]
MNRLVFSLSLSLATAAGVFAQGATVVVGGSPPEPSEPVNILFVNIDDMNDWTGMMERNP